jgi:hypothetical protein
MRLPDFILHKMDVIVAEWEAFAGTLFPASQKMSALALRDHVREIMMAVVADIRTDQSKAEQTAKSQGRAAKGQLAAETAAETHAILRAKSGLDINQLILEYRALRASVLRLWQESAEIDGDGFQDMIRFNEAIDQALAESVNFFTAKVEETRNLLLGALGHDMKSPLQAILFTARSLARPGVGLNLSRAAESLVQSGASIQALVDDLVDFSRSTVGEGILIEPSDCDLRQLFEDEIELERVANPDAVIESSFQGNLGGRWDGRRLQQVLRNLLTNAIEYGDRGVPIRVRVVGEAEFVSFSVINCGPVIRLDVLERLFDPLKRGVSDDEEGSRGHLGIGLYIAREITRAHRGQIKVASAADETVFTVQLPRESKSRD